MRDENPKKSKLSWSKKMVRKWFNIKSKSEDFQADDHVCGGGGEVEYRTSFSEREPCTIKKSKTEKISRNTEQSRRGRMNLDHPRIIDVENYSIFVATWNVAGRSPPGNLNLEDLLHASSPADIYVLGFQEIVPLNAGNILGAEDNGPAKKWLSLIRKTLNNLPGTSGGGACYTPSPVPQPIVEVDADFEGSSRQKNSSFFHCRSFQTTSSWRMDNDPSVPQPRLDRRFSVCDRVIFTCLVYKNQSQRHS
ncbi:COTYLEDON VASCULAR PATTERN 2 [Hibiscus trionum]|uniref:COTYLEDON VASCULAR PATTERN 2 n=1 Tax=Hibiscus trionum TaxID=183268 RepID=A0A9W7MC36_HIBTR|nr:COTYLEDON VASCULAR PATTERN 2 [Hibiscus trionum]